MTPSVPRAGVCPASRRRRPVGDNGAPRNVVADQAGAQLNSDRIAGFDGNRPAPGKEGLSVDQVRLARRIRKPVHVIQFCIEPGRQTVDRARPIQDPGQ